MSGALAREWSEDLLRPAKPVLTLPEAFSLVELGERPINPADTLLGDRFLCRKGGMLFVGPSGTGKSSASVQQDILWALGRPAFGIRPSTPLKILTVQAENDDGDIAEMVSGVCNALEITPEDKKAIRDRVLYCSCRTLCGVAFLSEVVEPLLAKHRPDIIRIDPLLAYLGGNVNDAEQTGAFLRIWLNPLIEMYNCAAILNHHTPKVINRDTKAWRGSDWMYAGAGSAELTNWARAIFVIDPTHASNIFRFHAAKRGSRIGWRDDFDQPEYARIFCHYGGGGIAWRDADANDTLAIEAKKPKKSGTDKTAEDLLQLVPATGKVSKKVLLSKAQNYGIGLNRASGYLAELVQQGDLFESKVKRPRTNPEIFISRSPQPERETVTADSHTCTDGCESPT